MLDDPHVLRHAVGAYRAAAKAVGIAWPDHAGTTVGQPPDPVYRIFNVDRIAEQLTWLESLGFDSSRLLPNGGWIMPWPTDVGEALDYLSFSIGTPFPWRHQMPLFNFDVILYTFVLDGEHEGEIWRYEISPDAWDAVRAATSLATLFTQWAKGIASGVVFRRDLDQWLLLDNTLLEQATDLDPFAFPASLIPNEQRLRTRQQKCGVDMDCIDRGAECQEELLDAIDTARASLDG
jgi:hypothetical protein